MSGKSATNGESREVGIRELRDGLSRYLAKVVEGERIVVTDHGKPIAEILPLNEYAAIARLEREGRIAPARSPKRDPGEPLDLGFSLSEFLER
ncbi:MAG: type II toxin-antitoxin system Phd/YefM family antitoxin [Solirubrobacterales bacterium]|nr:type II toxin-antitoxin system Phd/YefM family antitoxin [Solirubrobacterales bacterium]